MGWKIITYSCLVVVVVTQHGGEATFAEAATSSNPKTQKTQGTFQVEKEWYQPERRRCYGG